MTSVKGASGMPYCGKSFPLGATPDAGGTNFCIFSRHCETVDLLLFDTADDVMPSEVISLDPYLNRSYHYWHIYLPGVLKRQLYGYRINGPFDPGSGHRFDPGKVLLDPYARAIAVPDGYDRKLNSLPGPVKSPSMKSIVTDLTVYDWEGDAHPNLSFTDTVIYEMHVGGFTRNANSGIAEEKRGSYLGIVDRIPYLKELGITAVELLPVFQFDVQDAPGGLTNYWGYSPVSFFAPHQAYGTTRDPLRTLDEFRDMVKALHKAGIEVILDVVYNHTSENGESGPVYSFKGIDNSIYYILEHDKSIYSNYSGTGNTLNANQPVVRRMITDSLRYWVNEMHVDGFRFDLASILSRDESGHPLENPPVLWDIESDPVLAGTKLIAEAWDAAGLYQVGSFIGDSWKEWNGRFRDDVRRFMRGDNGAVSAFASRLLGSPDIYENDNREAEQSINFVTCHDGFTMNDLVAYNSKHNEANMEGNRDGSNDNYSRNYGIEGPSPDRSVEGVRNRQIKNFLALTMFSVGAPMLLMGDEVRRTQAGNNNAYCQDNAISWFDWSLLQKHADILRFVKQLIRYRTNRDSARQEYDMTLIQLLDNGLITWHGVNLFHPDWSYDSHSLAITVKSHSGRLGMHMMINAFFGTLEFEIPGYFDDRQCKWRQWIDTSLESPFDIRELEDAPLVTEHRYRLLPYSIAVLAEIN